MEHYHYIDSGLDNIYLQSGFKVVETPYGPLVQISNLEGLHFAIACTLAEQAAEISGKESRFLRIQMGLTQKLWAEQLGVDIGTVKKWEKRDTPLTGPASRLIKAYFLSRHTSQPHPVEAVIDRSSTQQDSVSPPRHTFCPDDGRWTDRCSALA